MDDLRLSGKEAVVLELLVGSAGRARYALDLVGESAGRLVRGTVYVTLARMEEKGLVESRAEEPPPGWIGYPRRLYTVTGRGQRLYEAWELARAHVRTAEGLL